MFVTGVRPLAVRLVQVDRTFAHNLANTSNNIHVVTVEILHPETSRVISNYSVTVAWNVNKSRSCCGYTVITQTDTRLQFHEKAVYTYLTF